MTKKSQPKEFTLDTEDKKVGGVAGGIAQYYETDVAWIRIAAVVMIILTGIIPGLIVYGVFYVLMKKVDAGKAKT